MISYSKIGHFGRLGNQLFQFSSTFGIAKKLGYEVAFPKENVEHGSVEHFKDGVTRTVVFDLPKAFEIPEHLLKENIKLDKQRKERFFHFDENLFAIEDNVDIEGYMQTDRYFSHCETELRSILTFKKEIRQTAEKLFPKVMGKTISIHVRLGDYVNLQAFHPVCEPDYYLKAAETFQNEHPYFIIFSDDTDHCKKIYEESENVLYIDNKDPYVDLCLMSMCDHNIIANSSFSWWAAWLNTNQDKTVIAPKKWFGPAYEGINDTKDLIPKNWKLM